MRWRRVRHLISVGIITLKPKIGTMYMHQNLYMTRFLSKFLLFVLCCWSVLNSTQSNAESRLKLLDSDRLTFEYAKIANNRDMYYLYEDPPSDEEHWDYSVTLYYNLVFVQYDTWSLRWCNRVRGESTNVQFRTVGWQFRVEATNPSPVKVFYDHESRHVLDAERTDLKYPLYNAFGVSIDFIRE